MNYADLTVIIPCYNSSQTIIRCLDSIKNQTLLPEKIIVVDDCSHDNTLDILKEYKKYNSKLNLEIFELNKNSGPASARNLGWDKSLTSYIAFLDSDDAWHKDKVYYQYNFMLSNCNCVISGHNFSIIDHSEINFVFFKKIFFKKFLFKNFFSTPSVMLKRDIPFRFDIEKRYSEDYKIWLEIVFNYPNGVFYSDAKLVTLFKSSYGESGLSGSLFKMQKGELECFYYLYCKNKINIILLILCYFFSSAKFLKRLFVTFFRKLKIV